MTDRDDTNRIDLTFAELAQNGRKGLFPFLVAGQVDLDTTIELILRFQQLGAAGIELGFPFSDSVADGSVIRTAYAQSLEGGCTVRKILQAISQAKKKITIPLIAMVSVSIVYKVGIDKFLDQVRQAGIDGLIVPDLSIEEAPTIADKADQRNLRLVMLVAPTSSQHRQELVAKAATGFLYYMSVAGITGERDKLPDDLVENVHRLKDLSGKPVVVGFGIKDASQVKLVCSVADGAIVGSAFVRRITDAQNEKADRAEIVDRLGEYLGELMTGLEPAG